MGQRRLGHRQYHGGGDDRARRQGLVLRHGELRARQGIEAEATNYIEKHGGKVLGSSKHPLGTSDFASFLLQAQNSKAKVIGLANAGGDTINAVKQAAEFGIQQGGQTMVAFLLFVNDVHGMGLKVAQGLQLLKRSTGTWMTIPARCKTLCGAARHERQDAERQPGRVYASTLAYLNAVAATAAITPRTRCRR